MKADAFRLAVRTLLLAALLAAGMARAGGETDGPWRLVLEISSFHDGHIATFERVVELRDGAFDGAFRSGTTTAALTFHVAGGRVAGNMAVVAGSDWNAVTVHYDGPLVDGVFVKDMVGPATYRTGFGGGFGSRNVSRNVDVTLRLERR